MCMQNSVSVTFQEIFAHFYLGGVAGGGSMSLHDWQNLGENLILSGFILNTNCTITFSGKDETGLGEDFLNDA